MSKIGEYVIEVDFDCYGYDEPSEEVVEPVEIDGNAAEDSDDDLF